MSVSACRGPSPPLALPDLSDSSSQCSSSSSSSSSSAGPSTPRDGSPLPREAWPWAPDAEVAVAVFPSSARVQQFEAGVPSRAFVTPPARTPHSASLTSSSRSSFDARAMSDVASTRHLALVHAICTLPRPFVTMLASSVDVLPADDAVGDATL